MYYVADTDRLLRDGVLSEAQVAVIRRQAREAMVALAVNVLLVGGIVAATLGLIAWLGEPMAVAAVGAASGAAGFAALLRGGGTLRFFGNAAALIGMGLLLGGAGLELADAHPASAGPVLTALGAAVAVGFAATLPRCPPAARFAVAAGLLIGVALHLFGLAFWLEEAQAGRWSRTLAALHAAVVLAAGGAACDSRLVTALAIVPFAQVLSTGAAYYHATYAFFSPEPVLTIAQMGLLAAACLLLARRLAPRWRRHAGVLAVMAAVVANLAALVGSLWGDWVGETIWGPGSWRWGFGGDQAEWQAARAAFRETALHVPDHAFSIAWALALGAAVAWAAHRTQRALFNTALVFAAIHAYTQLYETFGDEPLAYVIGGLATIPAAWAMWRLDGRLARRRPA